MNTKALGIGLLAAVLIICSATVIMDDSEAAGEPSITDVDYSSTTSIVHVTTTGFNGQDHTVRIMLDSQMVTFFAGKFDEFNIQNVTLDPTEYRAVALLNGVEVSSYPFTVYTVSFDANGGSGTVPEDVYATGTYDLPDGDGLSGPNGERFLGWSETRNGPVLGENYEVTEDVTLYAVWDTTADVPVESVTIDQEAPKVTVGGTTKLTATVTPDYATDSTVTWSSEDPGIATVDPETGVVTGVAVGEATITATAGGKTDSVVVSVEAGTIAVTGVELNIGSSTLTVGQTSQLEAKVLPDNATNKNVTWTSSNTAIATVDENGKVTTVSAGEAIITVTTVDGGLTASCTVTVEDVPPVIVDVTGVTLDKSEMTLYDDNKTGTLTAIVSPSNATNKDVTWSSDDETIVTVNENGVVTPVSAGTATITVTTVDGNHTATCVVTVDEVVATGIVVEPVKDIYEVDEKYVPDVYVYLRYNNGTVSETPLDATDYTVDYSKIDTSKPGTYLVTVTCGDFVETYKVTVKTPGQVVIDVTVLGGGIFGTLTLDCDGETKVFDSSERITVDEGTLITITYDTDLIITPTLTLNGEPIKNGDSFTADSDARVMISFIADDDDDDKPVNPTTPVQDGGDDSSTYIVAIAAAAVVAILAALILMQTRKS